MVSASISSRVELVGGIGVPGGIGNKMGRAINKGSSGGPVIVKWNLVARSGGLSGLGWSGGRVNWSREFS